jgi:hypothetical protein
LGLPDQLVSIWDYQSYWLPNKNAKMIGIQVRIVKLIGIHMEVIGLIGFQIGMPKK